MSTRKLTSFSVNHEGRALKGEDYAAATGKHRGEEKSRW